MEFIFTRSYVKLSIEKYLALSIGPLSFWNNFTCHLQNWALYKPYVIFESFSVFRKILPLSEHFDLNSQIAVLKRNFCSLVTQFARSLLNFCD